MGYLFFEILSEIAHFKNHKQVKNIHLQILLTINAIQHLALLFPNNGWKIWKYQVDSSLNYFQRLLNYFLILPITQGQKLIFEIIIFLIFAIQISIFLIIAYFIFQRKIVAKAKFTKGIFQILLSFVNFYFQNINLAISMPMLIFYINGIFCNDQFQDFATTYTCSLQATFYISIFGVILTMISQSLTIYFFRSYTLKPFSILQSKYSANSFIIMTLRPIAIFLFCFQQSQFQNDIFFITYNFLIIVLIVDSYYVNSYHPPHNDFSFKLVFSILAISALITLSVLSSKNLQTLILVETMLVGAAAYNISITILRRRLYHKPHSQLFAQCKTVDLVQRINELFEEQQEQFFLFYFLIINHCGSYEKNTTKKIINQFLQNQLKYARANGKIAYEQVQLVYIDFLLNFRKKPLISLVEFKKYEIYSKRQQTFYFEQMKRFINDDIEKQVQKQQQQNHDFFISDQEKQSLDIKHISKSLIFEDLYIPSFIKIIDQKIKIWEQSIKGYDSIYDFQEVAINLSRKVQELQKLLLPSLSFETHFNTNSNVLELKIASIFYSSVMNDYYNSAQCEFLITEILNIEHVLSQNIITNLTLIEDKVVLIMISLIKNLGQITNKDTRSISAYFGYDEKEFQTVQFINQLMPSYLSTIHDYLLKEYLQKAKSKLFSQYNLVFSCNQSGFLIPQQLKIDNNFNIKDDYVIMGCLSQIKKGVDFLLFGEDGKIWGCTENFFTNYIVSNNESLTLPKFINSCYIYMLIPQLIKIIDSYKKKYTDLLNETFTIVETASLIISHDLIDLMTQFSLSYQIPLTQIKLNYHKLSDDSKSGVTRRNISVSEKQGPEIYYEQSEEQNENSQKGKIKFLNKEVQQEINSILTSINYQTTEKYLAKFSLSCKSFGKDHYFRQYFIIEFHDIRKRDLIGQSISTTNQVNQYDTKYQSIQNNQDQTQDIQSNQSNLNQSGFTQTDQPSSEIVPQIKDIGCGPAEGIKRMGRSKKNKLDSDNIGQYNLDSGRDSLSYGPLSQRAHFINPNQQNDHLFEKIDQDFNEMDIQLNSVSAILQQQRQEQFDAQGEFELDDSANKKQQQQEQGKSSSVKEKENQIINIIHKNQLKGKTHEGEEIDVIKSKSSITSGTSGNQAIQLIKSFQSLTHLTSSLKSIAFINAIIFSIVLVLIVTNVVIIYINHVETENNINDIYGPLILSRNYLEILSFSWSMVLDTLEIVTFSEFMKKQQMDDLSLMATSLNEKIYDLFSGFVDVEQRGLLSEQHYTFLNGDQEEMLFPYFINLIQLNLNRVAQIIEYTELNQILNPTYLNELFLLRFNLDQLQSTTSELIDSLNLIFINQTLSKATEMQTQVTVEIICIAIFLIIELFCWKQVMNYCQLLMLLAGRLQESDANELIARATLVKETLQQQGGKYSWKKQNYYSLNYQQLNTLNLDMQDTQSKILKDLFYKNNQDNTEKQFKQQKNTKRNINVVLSSRIQNTQINFAPYILMVGSIFLILSFIFLGGFLLFQQQTNDLGPSQTLLANYIKFSSKMDTLVTCSLITKTQPLLYEKLIEMEVYDNQTISSFSPSTDVIQLFADLNEVYSENLTAIYNDILISSKISENVKQTMFILFQNTFCQLLSYEIPMCNIDTMGLEAFSLKYGTPNLKLDDNREFLSKGIQGVESHLDVLYQLLFYYEQDNLQFQPDLVLSKKQANQMEFRSGIFDHFLDTNDGTNDFFDLIYTNTVDILNENLVYMLLYYGILGFAIVLCYAIFYITFIIHTNNKLIRIRLALITLPISIITDQHTISLLKKLS